VFGFAFQYENAAYYWDVPFKNANEWVSKWDSERDNLIQTKKLNTDKVWIIEQ
jgi:hypothetical protein